MGICFGISVRCARRGKHKTADARFYQRTDQGDTVGDVIFVVHGGIGDRFPNVGQRREVDAGFELVL